ncbi:leucine-rich repeat LGI family member 3 precursor-like [Arapaima gigas]
MVVQFRLVWRPHLCCKKCGDPVIVAVEQKLHFYLFPRVQLPCGAGRPDYSFSRVYLWESAAQRFQPFQELNVRGPQAFRLLSVDSKDLLLAASFKGNTLAYQHQVLDLRAK